MMRAVILPTQDTFQEWLIDLNRSFPGLIVPTPLPNQDWWKLAMMLIFLNGKLLSNVVLPMKQAFPKNDDWKKWALMFIQSTTNT
jgi:hypothetical protein